MIVWLIHSIGPIMARMLAFPVAANVTWRLNRMALVSVVTLGIANGCTAFCQCARLLGQQWRLHFTHSVIPLDAPASGIRGCRSGTGGRDPQFCHLK